MRSIYFLIAYQQIFVVGKNGIEKIVELNLNEDEKAKFAASAKAVHGTNAALKEVGAL